MEKYKIKNNHYLYKITNVITKEYYLGVRSCDCEVKKDRYMGSSQIWTKEYIKDNKQNLKKEILNEFLSREEADINEVILLKENEHNSLCINILYDSIPSWLGKKQTKEHINKRKLCGKRNGMFGKHHTEEVKLQISESLKGRTITEETREKMCKAQKGRTVSEETKEKLRVAKEIKKLIIDTITNEQWIMGLKSFAAEHNLVYTSLRYAEKNKTLYKKRYKVECINDAAFIGNNDCKLGENGE
jgi:hypothetical protein